VSSKKQHDSKVCSGVDKKTLSATCRTCTTFIFIHLLELGRRTKSCPCVCHANCYMFFKHILGLGLVIFFFLFLLLLFKIFEILFLLLLFEILESLIQVQLCQLGLGFKFCHPYEVGFKFNNKLTIGCKLGIFHPPIQNCHISILDNSKYKPFHKKKTKSILSKERETIEKED